VYLDPFAGRRRARARNATIAIRNLKHFTDLDVSVIDPRTSE
jgi:hypothetical protein